MFGSGRVVSWWVVLSFLVLLSVRMGEFACGEYGFEGIFRGGWKAE